MLSMFALTTKLSGKRQHYQNIDILSAVIMSQRIFLGSSPIYTCTCVFNRVKWCNDVDVSAENRLMKVGTTVYV